MYKRQGGNNVNKHLAYMALANSATDQWTDFDIDRCIVVDDFETNVPGTFDFIEMCIRDRRVILTHHYFFVTLFYRNF